MGAPKTAKAIRRTPTTPTNMSAQSVVRSPSTPETKKSQQGIELQSNTTSARQLDVNVQETPESSQPAIAPIENVTRKQQLKEKKSKIEEPSHKYLKAECDWCHEPLMIEYSQAGSYWRTPYQCNMEECMQMAFLKLPVVYIDSISSHLELAQAYVKRRDSENHLLQNIEVIPFSTVADALDTVQRERDDMTYFLPHTADGQDIVMDYTPRYEDSKEFVYPEIVIYTISQTKIGETQKNEIHELVRHHPLLILCFAPPARLTASVYESLKNIRKVREIRPNVSTPSIERTVTGAVDSVKKSSKAPMSFLDILDGLRKRLAHVASRPQKEKYLYVVNHVTWDDHIPEEPNAPVLTLPKAEQTVEKPQRPKERESPKPESKKVLRERQPAQIELPSSSKPSPDSLRVDSSPLDVDEVALHMRKLALEREREERQRSEERQERQRMDERERVERERAAARQKREKLSPSRSREVVDIDTPSPSVRTKPRLRTGTLKSPSSKSRDKNSRKNSQKELDKLRREMGKHLAEMKQLHHEELQRAQQEQKRALQKQAQLFEQKHRLMKSEIDSVNQNIEAVATGRPISKPKPKPKPAFVPDTSSGNILGNLLPDDDSSSSSEEEDYAFQDDATTNLRNCILWWA